MQKYEEGLTDAQLDKKITDEGGELLPKEKPENLNLQNVIMDGYIFEIDRSVPKIVDYIGRADGIVITASIIQDNNWTNPTATVKGTIKTFSSGERIVSSSANVTSGSADVSSFPTSGGEYTISGITTDTTIVITVTDSKGETKIKEIPVVIKKDTTGPNIVANVTANKLKIKIDVTATDTESGLQSLTYSISPTTGITNSTGPLTSGTPKEITTTAEETYTITITAMDNAGNTSTKTIDSIKTVDGITVAEAKEKINASNIKDYIGTKIIDYNPTAGGTWRVFYYDDDNYFGDGAGTLYLKRDWEADDTEISSYASYSASADGIAKMKQMNPKWRDSTEHSKEIELANEKCVSWLCDPSKWEDYKVDGIAKYAIGSPSVEMYMKAFNLWKTGDKDANNLVCKMDATSRKNGYLVGANGSYSYTSGYVTEHNAIEAGPSNIFMPQRVTYWWLASPSSYSHNDIFYVDGYYCYISYGYEGKSGVCPIVALNH